MIDLHSHVLPGLDDGPPDLDGALEICRAAADEGIEILAATPHVRDDYPERDDYHWQRHITLRLPEPQAAAQLSQSYDAYAQAVATLEATSAANTASHP